jgi:hypothetical protein
VCSCMRSSAASALALIVVAVCISLLFLFGFTHTAATAVAGPWLGAWVVAAAAVSNVGLFEAEMRSVSFEKPLLSVIHLTLL